MFVVGWYHCLDTRRKRHAVMEIRQSRQLNPVYFFGTMMRITLLHPLFLGKEDSCHHTGEVDLGEQVGQASATYSSKQY